MTKNVGAHTTLNSQLWLVLELTPVLGYYILYLSTDTFDHLLFSNTFAVLLVLIPLP